MFRKIIASLLLLPLSLQAADDLQALLPRGMTPVALSDETDSLSGGALSTAEHPTRQELMDRASYWDSRGRSDLAAKLRVQYQLPENKSQPPVPVQPVQTMETQAAPLNLPPLTESVAPLPVKTETLAVEAPPVKSSPAARADYWQARGRSDLAGTSEARREIVPQSVMPLSSEKQAPVVRASPQDLQTRADYWQSRGRSDLAEKVLSPTVSESAKSSSAGSFPAAKPVAQLVVQTGLKPLEEERPVANVPFSRQTLNDNAQYWASRGRSDLAEQIRQQLQHNGLPDSRVERSGAGRRDYEKTDNNQHIDKSSLEDELLKSPNNLKARLDLAQIYRSTGEMAKSRALIDGVLASHPDMAEALLASANLYAEQHLWQETLFVLEKVSPVARTAEMAKLQKMAWAHVQLDRADALLRQGDTAEAELLLRRIATELAINSRRQPLPEPPELWNSAPRKLKKVK